MTQSSSQTKSSENSAEFVSPAEAQSLLINEEEHDKRYIGVALQETSFHADESEEGEFVSPETFSELENKRSGKFPEVNTQPLSAGTRKTSIEEADTAPAGVQSDLLTRIAGELRTIKSELSSLKNHYDEVAVSQNTESREAEKNVPEDKRHMLDNEQYEDIKKLLSYLDKLLESLPEDRIDEFARSEYFNLYRRVFEFFDLA